MEEIWGPTAQQLKYEPPHQLAHDLGNNRPGDGKRYKGRGPIQITGRANYRAYGKQLGLDLEALPEQASTPAVGFAIAAAYWKNRGLNELADAGDYQEITKRINGGLTGYDDRVAHWERAKDVLAA